MMATTATAGSEIADDSAQDALVKSVDHLLASSLNDPLSATDYRVSGPVACKLVLPAGQLMHDQCVCYSVNAKNSLGGYTGVTMYVAEFIGSLEFPILMPGEEVKAAGAEKACESAKMKSRPVSEIAKYIGR